LQKALVADVNYGPAHNNLGQLYFLQRKFYLAAWEFESATKLMPECPEPQNNLGLVFEEVGKFDEAINCYRTALSLQSNNPEIIGNLARTLVRQEQFDEETRGLLEGLVSMDTRPEWVAWAREQLALHEQLPPREKKKSAELSLPETIPTPPPMGTPEPAFGFQELAPPTTLPSSEKEVTFQPEGILHD
jgi:tetratricopeptide (TPR) repeat protein